MSSLNISLVRIDNRLVHGQILEAWIPFIKASCVVVANDDVADDFFQESAIKMAVPSEIEVVVNSVEEFSENYSYCEKGGRKTIVLFCNVCDALKAYRSGFRFKKLNIGNVHRKLGAKQFIPAVHLSEKEVKDLQFLVDSGVNIKLMSLPADVPVDFRDVMKKT